MCRRRPARARSSTAAAELSRTLCEGHTNERVLYQTSSHARRSQRSILGPGARWPPCPASLPALRPCPLPAVACLSALSFRRADLAGCKRRRDARILDRCSPRLLARLLTGASLSGLSRAPRRRCAAGQQSRRGHVGRVAWCPPSCRVRARHSRHSSPEIPLVAGLERETSVALRRSRAGRASPAAVLFVLDEASSAWLVVCKNKYVICMAN